MSVDLGVVQLRSLVECCDTMREHHEEVVLNSKHLRGLRKKGASGRGAAEWENKGEGGGGSTRGNKTDEGQTRSPERAEGRRQRDGYLPVEWHTRFKGRLYREGGGSDIGGGVQGGNGAGQASPAGVVRTAEGDGDEGSPRIWDITLPRAPTLRAFTNDTLLDILYFMSPEYHQVIVEEVTQEINRVLDLFRKHTRNWSGKVSIVAHSLGAIICFDIMANQPPSGSFSRASGGGNTGPPTTPTDTIPVPPAAAEGNDTDFPALSARVENVFCLGSPIGMFLMIRGQHRRLGKAFRLPGCRRLFNIFHPYDPVAFRLEPLLRADNAAPGDEALPSPTRDPVILPTWTGRLRVHYQVQRWWQDLWSRAWEAKQRAEASIERSLESIGLIDEQHHGDDGDDGDACGGISSVSSSSSLSSEIAFAMEEQAAGDAGIGGSSPDAGVANTTPALEAAAVAAGMMDGFVAAPHGGAVEATASEVLETPTDLAMQGQGQLSRALSQVPPAPTPALMPHAVALPPPAQTPPPPLESATSGRGSPLQEGVSRGGSGGVGDDVVRHSSHDCPTAAAAAAVAGEEEEVDSEGHTAARGCTSAAPIGSPAAPSDVQQQQQQKEGRHEQPKRAARSSAAAPAARAAGRRAARTPWQGALMEEDLEKNGALAGGRRVDYCLQEKEFEVTNEYIFALGSHVIYWGSKDVSLFVAQQVVADAIAGEHDGCAPEEGEAVTATSVAATVVVTAAQQPR
ncbi:unnamed protein product [Scytosiphon promiscuus]